KDNIRVLDAHMPVQSSTTSFAFLEFSAPNPRPVRPRLQDPGAVLLHYTVRDIEGVTARLKAAGARVIPEGGEPVTDGTNTRVIVLRDPSGLFIDLHQPPPRD